MTKVNEQHPASRNSRSSSTAAKAVPVAEYQEWPFHGLLKRTRTRDGGTYIIKFKLPSILEHIHLLINALALDSKEVPAETPIQYDASIPLVH